MNTIKIFEVENEVSFIGRRFFKGDKIFIFNKVLFHSYINRESNCVEVLKSPWENVNIENREKLMSNCKEVDE